MIVYPHLPAELSSCLNFAVQRENQLSSRDLTLREMLILRSLIEGASNKVIALKLVMTELTVKGACESHFAEAPIAEPHASSNLGPRSFRGW